MEKWTGRIGMDRICGITVLLIGLAIVWQATELKLGSFRVPGPGLYPLLLGLVTVLLSLFLIISPGKGEKKGSLFSRENMFGVARIYAIMLLYTAILEYTGFLIAGFLFIFFLFAFIGRMSLGWAAIRAFIVTVAAYLLFDLALKSQLPKGILGI